MSQTTTEDASPTQALCQALRRQKGVRMRFFTTQNAKKKKNKEKEEEHNSELFHRPLCTTVGRDPGRVVAGIFQAPHKLTPRRPPLHWCTVFASAVHLWVMQESPK